MGILPDIYQRVPKFHKQNPYHPYSRDLFDDVDGIVDSTAIAYQYREGTTSQDNRQSILGVGTTYYHIDVPRRQGIIWAVNWKLSSTGDFGHHGA